jgi:hypothetical protein
MHGAARLRLSSRSAVWTCSDGNLIGYELRRCCKELKGRIQIMKRWKCCETTTKQRRLLYPNLKMTQETGDFSFRRQAVRQRVRKSGNDRQNGNDHNEERRRTAVHRPRLFRRATEDGQCLNGARQTPEFGCPFYALPCCMELATRATNMLMHAGEPQPL